jgi:hypothetical protein
MIVLATSVVDVLADPDEQFKRPPDEGGLL